MAELQKQLAAMQAEAGIPLRSLQGDGGAGYIRVDEAQMGMIMVGSITASLCGVVAGDIANPIVRKPSSASAISAFRP